MNATRCNAAYLHKLTEVLFRGDMPLTMPPGSKPCVPVSFTSSPSIIASNSVAWDRLVVCGC